MSLASDILAGKHVIQCLDILVDPNAAALPVDDPQVPPVPVPFIIPPLIGFHPASFTPVPPPGGGDGLIRPGGSGVSQGNGKSNTVLRAVGDSGEAEVEGPDVDIDILANDSYAGNPSAVLTSSSGFGIGSISGGVFTYSPPGFGDLPDPPPTSFSDVFTYELTASGNPKKKSSASIVITVSAQKLELNPATTTPPSNQTYAVGVSFIPNVVLTLRFSDGSTSLNLITLFSTLGITLDDVQISTDTSVVDPEVLQFINITGSVLTLVAGGDEDNFAANTAPEPINVIASTPGFPNIPSVSAIVYCTFKV